MFSGGRPGFAQPANSEWMPFEAIHVDQDVRRDRMVAIWAPLGTGQTVYAVDLH